MDKKVESTIKSALKQFSKISRYDTGNFERSILGVFDSDDNFLDKIAALDGAFDKEPELDPLREIFVDLIMINFFTEDVKKLEEDYLESPEWNAIEEQTLDRGTELLNLFLYLKECQDEEIQPELTDYLKEFLLVDEDEFQDEYRIYEDLIANQILVESSVEEIAKAANNLPETSEMKELFYPVMTFFFDEEGSSQTRQEYISHSKNPAFDSSVYALLVTYTK